MNDEYKKGYSFGYHDAKAGQLPRPDTGNSSHDFGYSVGYEDGIYHEKKEW